MRKVWNPKAVFVYNSQSLHEAGLVETNAHVSVIADFPDKENFVAYGQHPTHLSIVNGNKALVANRLAIQYEPPQNL